MQEHTTHSSNLSSTLSSSNTLTSNPTALVSSVVSDLGWKDQRPAIMVAEQVDNDLAIAFKNAHDAYERTPNEGTKNALLRRLDDLEERLEEERDTAEKLQKAAEKRLADAKAEEAERLAKEAKGSLTTTPDVDTGVSSYIHYPISALQTLANGFVSTIQYGLQTAHHTLQTAFGSDDASLVERYSGIAKRCREDLVTLSNYRKTFIAQHNRTDATSSGEAESPELLGAVEAEEPEQVVGGVEETNVAANPEVLELSTPGAKALEANSEEVVDEIEEDLPEAASPTANPPPNTRRTLSQPPLPNTTARYCYPTGTCSLTTLSDGVSGFMAVGWNLGDQAGDAITGLGDVNGDGIDDFAVGMQKASPSGRTNAGRVQLMFGSNKTKPWGSWGSGLAPYSDGKRGVSFYCPNPYDMCGWEVARIGDMNGDGFNEIVISASNASVPGAAVVGTVYVVFGSKQLSNMTTGVLELSNMVGNGTAIGFHGEGAGDQLGYSLDRSGDVNGDGLADLLVGAPYASSFGSLNTGAAYWIFGRQNNTWPRVVSNISLFTDGVQGVKFGGGNTGDLTGIVVSWVGDITGSGVNSVAIGATFHSSPSAYRDGTVYFVHGSRQPNAWMPGSLNLTTFMDGIRGFALTGNSYPGNILGYPITGGGDNNGDGIPDVVLGANAEAFLIFGSNQSNAWRFSTRTIGTFTNGVRGVALANFASSDYGLNKINKISNNGDIDGDGIDDLVVGLPTFSPQTSMTEIGCARVLLGSNRTADWNAGLVDVNATTANGTRGFTLLGESEGDYAGAEVSTADINGDGLADILVGAPQISGVGSIFGKIYAVYGIRPNGIRFTANHLSLAGVDTVVLDSTMLAAVNSTGGSATIQFNPTNLVSSYFAYVSPPSNVTYVFSPQNVTSGAIQFVHIYNQSAPQARILVNFTKLVTYSSDTTFDFTYPTLFSANNLAAIQGFSITLQPSNLNVASHYQGPANVTLNFADIQHAQFNEIDPTTQQVVRANITQTTQQTVLDGGLQVVHDNSLFAPSYSVVADDSHSLTPKNFSVITFRYSPQLTLKDPIVIDQGQPTTVTFQDMGAVQEGVLTESLVIEVENVTNMYLSYTGDAEFSINAFSQLPLIIGNVQAMQNGTGAEPSFWVRASDGTINSAWRQAPVRLNYRPVSNGNVSDVSCTQNQLCTFTQNIYFTDANNDTLIVGAQLAGGAPLPKEVMFSPPNEFIAKLSTLSLLQIEMFARDPRGLTTISETFALSTEAPPAAASGFNIRTFYSTASSVGGIAIAFAGYFVWRRYTAGQRREYELARDLRKIMNLEYHDFTKGRAEIFKTRIENLVQRLNLKHDNFYTKLTAEERPSFAMCVAGILQQKGLVRPSGPFSGTWGWVRCFTEGWSNELNLTQLANLEADIAVQAVARWQAQENPTQHWAYVKRTRVQKLKACFCCCVTPGHKARLARLEQDQEVEMSEVVVPTARGQGGASPRHQPSAGMFGREAGNREERLAQLQQEKKAMKKQLKRVDAELADLEAGHEDDNGPTTNSNSHHSSSHHSSRGHSNPPSPLNMTRAQSGGMPGF